MRYVVCLLTLFVMACSTPADMTPDLLYRTYTYVQKNPGGTDQTVIVTLTRQNEVRFGVDKQLAICCAPTRFRATTTTIEFLGPEVPNPVCAAVDCRMSELVASTPWQIERLNAIELVITTNQQRLVLTAQ
ncbi:hypothetical protein [Fibrella aestuarina]|nr:hypothetical protein [Fibrella aestuarina]